MSTISQWAVYQMCQTLDNNYSYVVKIIKDIYPELYSESPTYDWERKSILGCFHKNFSKLLTELSKQDIEKEKDKPFQWSNWKESSDEEATIIDLTHRIPTNWKIYKIYKNNKGSCVDMLDIMKEKYPNFAIPDDCTDDQLYKMICKNYKKIQKIIDNGCEEKLKKEKKTPFTWKSEELRNSTVHCPSSESGYNHPTHWDIYQLCKVKKHKYQYIVQILKKKYPDLYIPSKSTDLKLQTHLRTLLKKISDLKKNNSKEFADEKKKKFSWCNEDSNFEKTTQFTADDLNKTELSVNVKTIDEDSSETSTNFVPIDNHYFSTSPSASHLNGNITSLPVSQLQTPPPTGTPPPPLPPLGTPISPIDLPQQITAAASPSPIENEPDVTSDSECENLILAIERFENLISEAVAEIATKDAKIEYLQNEINKVMKNQKKVSSNLKRLQFQHLRQKIST